MAWAPDYCTASDLASFVRITDSVDDAQLGLAVTTASRAVDRHCNRQFGIVDAPQERYYEAAWDRRLLRWVIRIDDLMTVDGLDVEFDSYTLHPRNAAAQGRPWTYLVVGSDSTVRPEREGAEVAITATWGWSAVPVPVKEATLLQASRLFARRNSPFGVAGSPDVGSELRLLERLDPDVATSLGSFVRWWGAA